MCGAKLLTAGRGMDENLRSWAKMKIRGAVRGKKAHKSTDPKIWQKCGNWRICITVWCFDQGKHYILWLLNGLSANQIITSCTKDQGKNLSLISPLTPRKYSRLWWWSKKVRQADRLIDGHRVSFFPFRCLELERGWVWSPLELNWKKKDPKIIIKSRGRVRIVMIRTLGSNIISTKTKP